jgi:hypothetical protein
MNTAAAPILAVALLAAACHGALPPLNAAAFAAAPDAPFSGEYNGKTDDGDATLSLTQSADGTVTGTLKMGGDTMSLKGTASGDRVTGTCSLNGQELPLRFELTRQGAGGLKFAMVFGEGGAVDPDTVIVFTRAGGAKAVPVAPAKPAVGTKPAASAPTTAAPVTSGKVFTHPTGMTVRYPASWAVKEASTAALLLPPDIKKDAAGKVDELYLVGVDSAGGVSDIRDPRVLADVEQKVTQLGATLRRVGEPAYFKTGAKEAVALTYEGDSQGATIQARVYAAIHGPLVVAIIGLAEKSRIAPRDADLRAILASAKQGPSKLDPLLVGTWKGAGGEGGLTATQHGRITAQSSSTSNTRITLAMDGTALSVTTDYTVAVSGTFGIDSTSETKKKGRWSTSGGKLTIQWEDGKIDAAPYRVEGDRVILAGGAAVYVRVR